MQPPLLSWTPDPSATGYDVAQGLLGTLHLTSGDYGAATLLCLVNDEEVTETALPEDPAPGEAFWFLVRPVNCGGAGSYGSAARDSAILLCR